MQERKSQSRLVAKKPNKAMQQATREARAPDGRRWPALGQMTMLPRYLSLAESVRRLSCSGSGAQAVVQSRENHGEFIRRVRGCRDISRHLGRLHTSYKS